MGAAYDVSDAKLGDLLDGRQGYDIPDYQRDYSWDTEHVEKLWRDLSRNNDQEYLLGPMVIADPDNTGRFDVIDGQQRLATLTLMLCAIRDYVYEHVKDDYPARESFLRYINKRISNQDGEILRLGEKNKDVFLELQRNTKEKKVTKTIKTKRRKSNKLLLGGYNILYEKITEFCDDNKLNFNDDLENSVEKLRDMMDAMLQNNTFACVVVKKIEYAPQVFEALNTTGAKLTQADLIKYAIMKNCSRNKQDTYKRKWDHIMDVVDPDKDLFIYQSLHSRHPYAQVPVNGRDEPLRMKNLYNIVTSKYNDDEGIEEYLDHLEKDSSCFHLLSNPDDVLANDMQGNRRKFDESTRKTKIILEGMNDISAKYIKVPVLAACREWGYESTKFQSLIDCMVRFFFRFRTVSDGSTDTVRLIAKEVTNGVINGEDLPDIISHILIRDNGRPYTDMVGFSAAFKEYASDGPSEKNAKYILKMFEEQLRTRSDYDVDVSYESFQLEHILPRNPNNEWDLDVDFPTGGDEDKLEAIKKRLGNLTLIKGSWNAGLKNRKFTDKRDGIFLDKRNITRSQSEYSYKKSSLRINIDYMKYDKWTLEDVKKREQDLCDLACDTWSLEKFFKIIDRNET